MTDDGRRRDEDAYGLTAPGPDAMTPGPGIDGTTPALRGTLDLPAGDQVAVRNELVPGDKIGHFTVRAPLGEGGMGVVVAGIDEQLGRQVAIKLVRGDLDHSGYRARLLREAQAMARLEHPNVVRVYEIGTDRGRTFVAMELIEGVTLTSWLRVQRRSWREVLAMFHQVGVGLAAVHRVGLVHRDFKPDNVLVDRGGRAKVADFGLARVDPDVSGAGTTLSPVMGAPLTGTGVMMGTPGYMAPEQQFGGDVDGRADQYSYCVALREALLGGRPKQPEEVDWGSVPRTVRTIVTRGLSYEPEQRFASMDELLVALGRAGTRRRAVIGAAIAVIALCGGVGAAAVIALRESPAAEPVAVAPSAAPPRDASPTTAPRDAPALATIAPTDAAVVIVAPVDAAGHAPVHRDASVTVGVVPADASTPSGPPPSGPPPSGPPPAGPVAWSLRTPLPAAANPADPSHLAIVRATIKGLGYDGFEPKLTADDVALLSEDDLAVGQIKLAMIERAHGRCEPAAALIAEATQALGPRKEPQWRARAAENLALCQLASGQPADAAATAASAWVSGNHLELELIMAITEYERGDLDASYGMFLTSSRQPSPPVRAAIQTWVAGTGLTLP